MAFAQVGLHLRFEGEGVDEVGILERLDDVVLQPILNGISNKVQIGTVVVRIDPTYFRPTEVDVLLGDPTKAQTQLGWKPQYDLPSLVQEMVAADVALFKKELHLLAAGHSVNKQQE